MNYTKDYYSVLGVSPSASQEEISRVYLSRVKVLHPDRFDSKSKEWGNANEMLAELNEAYSVLQEIQSRKEYDISCGRNSKIDYTENTFTENIKTTSATNPDFDKIISGKSLFNNLSKDAQKKVIDRQNNLINDQIKIKFKSSWENIFKLLIPISWYVFLILFSNGSKWTWIQLLMFFIISICVSIITGFYLINIYEWTKSTLKSFFYLTPLYFIKTDFDILYYWALWDLKDISTTNIYQNSNYKNSIVTIEFIDNHTEKLIFKSIKKVELFYKKLNEYRDKISREIFDLNSDYFFKNNDFEKVEQINILRHSRITSKKKLFIYISSFILTVMILIYSCILNINYYDTYWHNLIYPKINTHTNEDQSQNIQRKPLPINGKVTKFTSLEAIAPLSIKTSGDEFYLVKLVELNTNITTLTIFIHGGQSVELNVPIGKYSIRYASGKQWYGDEYLFGPDTIYSKAREIFNFELINNQVSGYTLTLYKVANGNLQTSIIKSEEF